MASCFQLNECSNFVEPLYSSGTLCDVEIIATEYNIDPLYRSTVHLWHCVIVAFRQMTPPEASRVRIRKGAGKMWLSLLFLRFTVQNSFAM